MVDNLLNISEAAKLMGVCENTLRDWDIENKFKASRTIGNHRRYSLDQIREYLNRHPSNQKDTSLFLHDNQVEEILKKWKEYTDGCETPEDKKTLSILLENCERYRQVPDSSLII
jgi:excisionase family DNA binding protein